MKIGYLFPLDAKAQLVFESFHQIPEVDQRHERLVNIIAHDAGFDMRSFQFALSHPSFERIIFWMRLLYLIDTIESSTPYVEGIAPGTSLTPFFVGHLV